MKAIQCSFFQMIKCVKRDMMLFIACLSPLVIGIFFKYGIPTMERVLTNWFHISSLLLPYYPLIDIFFAMLTSTMFCFVTAMIVLEEIDDKIAKYLFITPLGKKGYLLARFGLPAMIACMITINLLPIFKLSAISSEMLIILAISGTLQGIIASLLIVSISSNKLEGMAVAKFATLTLFASSIPFFIKNNIQYIAFPLPSFWISKAVVENTIGYMLVACILSFVWIVLLMKYFMHKIR